MNEPLISTGTTHVNAISCVPAVWPLLLMVAFGLFTWRLKMWYTVFVLHNVSSQGRGWSCGAGQREVWGIDGVFPWNCGQHGATCCCFKSECNQMWNRILSSPLDVVFEICSVFICAVLPRLKRTKTAPTCTDCSRHPEASRRLLPPLWPPPSLESPKLKRKVRSFQRLVGCF